MTPTGNGLNVAALGGCTNFSSNGSEQVFSITLQHGQTLNLALESTDGDDTVDESLYILGACPGLCLDGVDTTEAAEALIYTHAAATAEVFVVADRFSFSDTEPYTYTLTWSVQ